MTGPTENGWVHLVQELTLLSADGTDLLKNFNEQNSPLLSNSIVSLAVDNKTGDVWFGTSKGIQSMRGDATTGEEKFTKVYTFPNPVQRELYRKCHYNRSYERFPDKDN